MHVTLTIQEKLKDLRVEKGLTLEELAEETGISKSALGNYENIEYKDISHVSIVTLAKYYDVSADYLLGLTENRERKNAQFADLHISDSMIDLLTSGRINNRLLCELAEHEQFVDLMTDMEIYVDGIASMQIQNLNTYLVTVRNEIINKYQGSESDIYMKTLEASQIREDDYFTNIIHKDIEKIMKDIREAHKKDSTSAPVNTFAEELKKDLESIEEFKGSQEEKMAAFYCKQLGVNYSKLTDLEFRTLIQILRKSDKLKSPISKRGKRK